MYEYVWMYEGMHEEGNERPPYARACCIASVNSSASSSTCEYVCIDRVDICMNG